MCDSLEIWGGMGGLVLHVAKSFTLVWFMASYTDGVGEFQLVHLF